MDKPLNEDLIKQIRFDDKGLVPCVAQDVKSGAVLMLAYMNEEALLKTLETKCVTYFSRSRQSLWTKGETSGNTQKLCGIYYDCDGDTILLKVDQKGVACHTGSKTCFFNEIWSDGKTNAMAGNAIYEDYATIIDRIENPKEDSYTNYLLEKGIDKICKKIGEEATEVVIAAKDHSKEEIVYESADLIYHLLVLLAEENLTPDDVFTEMDKRRS